MLTNGMLLLCCFTASTPVVYFNSELTLLLLLVTMWAMTLPSMGFLGGLYHCPQWALPLLLVGYTIPLSGLYYCPQWALSLLWVGPWLVF